jgi:hypothetical protein
MPTTPNYGWDTPADTDYVTNGALSIRTLGDDIDTTVKANQTSATNSINTLTSSKVAIAGDTMTGVLVIPTVTASGYALAVTQSVADDEGIIQFRSSNNNFVRANIRTYLNTKVEITLNSNQNDFSINNLGETFRAHDGETRVIPFAMECGLVTVSANSSVSVSFNSGRFLQAPLVQVTGSSTSTAAVTGHAGSVSTSGFTLYNTTAATRNFAWQAVQMRYATAEG